MATQLYSSQDQRVGIIKGEMLKHAEPREVLALGGTMKKMPRNAGDNISYRRVVPYGAAVTNHNTINRFSLNVANHLVVEGTTPNPEAIVYQDVNVVLQQYACLYSYSDKAAELYEDDIPQDQKIQVGERMGLVREMIRYGALKAGSNVFYAGGTTRLTVDEPISLNMLRNVAKGLLANHAEMKTSVLAPGPNYDTSAVEAGFIVFAHTDLEPDIRDLPGFIPVAKYANKNALSPYEIGSVERFRFILSPELAPYLAAGAAIGATGMTAADNTTLDVYPMIVMGADAFFDIALRGANSLGVISIPHTTIDKSDPLGQRGYVGAKFYSAALVTNPGWMAVVEVASTAL